MFQFAEQPLSITKIWKAGFSLYRTTFSKIWYLAIAPYFLFYAVGFIEGFSVGLTKKFAHNQNINTTNFVQSLSTNHPIIFAFLLILLIAIIAIILLYFTILLIHRMHRIITSPAQTLKNSFKIAWHKLWPISLNWLYILLILISVFIIVFFLLSLFIESRIFNVTISILAALVISLSFMFCAPLIILDDCGAARAVKTSWQLSWGKWWQIIWSVWLPLIIIALLLLAIIIALNFVFNLQHSAITQTIIQILIIPIIIPLKLSFILVKFNDLKIRKQVLAKT